MSLEKNYTLGLFLISQKNFLGFESPKLLEINQSGITINNCKDSILTFSFKEIIKILPDYDTQQISIEVFDA